ncbi:MFS transporter [Microvirga tunisiensis]|uniref:MFS transporter n=1 Tax=Microvirga tunisiensis TaxID=2108360 RepID=A0A5N7MUF0_9HYPH|nr:MFS transporter [Microvirga tunisiensis]MPR05439.1 MFS transporter [Microvirga tunisiensis]MPR30300.1 MFS transporter [Microvirga tunisiensis]
MEGTNQTVSTLGGFAPRVIPTQLRRGSNALENTATRAERVRRTSLIRGVLGVSFEYYDYVVFAAFAPYFANQFFPQDNPIAAGLNTLLVFALGFVMRPLGAMLAGRLADRFGRKPVMVAALALAACGSLAIACAPTYHSIGIAAVFLLVAARLAQGVAHGMESISAFVYTAEMASPKWRALQSCAYPMGLNLGVMQGTLFGAVLTSVLSDADMHQWGWRIPFIVGAMYGLFIVVLRRGMEESSAYEASKAKAKFEDQGYWRNVWKYRRIVLALLLIWPVTATAAYTLSVSFSEYAITMIGANPRDAYWAALIAQTAFLFALPCWAMMSDRFGRKFNYTIGFASVILLAYPLQLALGPSLLQIAIPMTIGLLFWAAVASTEIAFINELIPNRVRAQVMSIPSSMGAVLFGSTAPYLRSWSTAYVSPLAFTAYFILLAVIGLIAVRQLPETRGRDLAD